MTDFAIDIRYYRDSATGGGAPAATTLLDGGLTELPIVRDLWGQRYKCLVSVVDVDPKPVSCVEKHRRRNQAMNEAFLSASVSHDNQ